MTVELPSNKSERIIKIRPDVMLTLNCTPIINTIFMAGGDTVSNIMVEWFLLVIKVDGTFDDSQQTVTNNTDGYVIFLMFIHDLISFSHTHTHTHTYTHRIYISSDGSFLKVFQPIITSQAKLGNSGTYSCKIYYDQMQPFGPPLRRCVKSSSTVKTIGQKNISL